MSLARTMQSQDVRCQMSVRPSVCYDSVSCQNHSSSACLSKKVTKLVVLGYLL